MGGHVVEGAAEGVQLLVGRPVELVAGEVVTEGGQQGAGLGAVVHDALRVVQDFQLHVRCSRLQGEVSC
jgi:hypothetical protein